MENCRFLFTGFYCMTFKRIGRIGIVFFLFCLFHLREQNSWNIGRDMAGAHQFYSENRKNSVPLILEWVGRVLIRSWWPARFAVYFRIFHQQLFSFDLGLSAFL